MNIILVLAISSMLSVLGVLILGMVSMMKGGEFNRKYGNKLMIARVSLQALAVLFLMSLWLTSSK